MGAIFQHDITQIAGRARRHNLSAESPRIDKRKQSHMIDMGVRHQHIVHIRIRNRKFCIFILVDPLFHTAVNQNIQPACLQKMTAACNLMIRTDKCKPHKISPLFCRLCFRIPLAESVFAISFIITDF